ncbi:hypothetical protein D3C80_1421800 [compost metagenome]
MNAVICCRDIKGSSGYRNEALLRIFIIGRLDAIALCCNGNAAVLHGYQIFTDKSVIGSLYFNRAGDDFQVVFACNPVVKVAVNLQGSGPVNSQIGLAENRCTRLIRSRIRVHIVCRICYCVHGAVFQCHDDFTGFLNVDRCAAAVRKRNPVQYEMHAAVILHIDNDLTVAQRAAQHIGSAGRNGYLVTGSSRAGSSHGGTGSA